MKIVIWIGALVVFVAVIAAAHLLFPEPGSFVRDEDRVGAGNLDRRAALDGLLRTTRAGFSDVREALERESRRLATVLNEARREGLTSLCGSWEMDAADRSRLRERIVDALRATATQGRLDFLCLVTQGGEILSGIETGPDGALSDREHSQVVEACEPFFRDGQDAVEFTLVPRRLFTLSSARDGADPDLVLAAARPVWVRPDAPHSVLLGGVEVSQLARRLRDVVAASNSDLCLHFFADAAHGVPMVVAGDRVGTPVRLGLAAAVRRGEVSQKPAFAEVGPQVGCWQRLEHRDDRWEGGWGVSLSASAVEAALTPRETSWRAPPVLAVPSVRDALVVTGVLAVGVGLLWVFLVLWSRLVSAREPARSAQAWEPPERDANTPAMPRGAKGKWSLEEVAARLERLENDVGRIRRRLDHDARAERGLERREAHSDRDHVLA